MKNNFNIEVKKILKSAEQEMFDLNHPYVGSEHMLLAILKTQNTASKVLANRGLKESDFTDSDIKRINRRVEAIYRLMRNGKGYKGF